MRLELKIKLKINKCEKNASDIHLYPKLQSAMLRLL